MSSTPTPTRHPGGRPPLTPGERAVEPRFSLPTAHMRALAAIASAERMTLGDVCRRAIAKYLRDRQRQQARMARRVELTRGRIGL